MKTDKVNIKYLMTHIFSVSYLTIINMWNSKNKHKTHTNYMRENYKTWKIIKKCIKCLRLFLFCFSWIFSFKIPCTSFVFFFNFSTRTDSLTDGLTDSLTDVSFIYSFSRWGSTLTCTKSSNWYVFSSLAKHN